MLVYITLSLLYSNISEGLSVYLPKTVTYRDNELGSSSVPQQ